MMGFLGFFGSRGIAPAASNVDLWPMSIASHIFVELQINTVFSRLLSEVFSRSAVIPDEYRPLLRSSMEDNGQKGLIEHIVGAMSGQRHLVLVYEAGILVEPEYTKKQQIMEAVKKGKTLPRTIVMSYQTYHKTTALRQYLLHKYLLLCTQHKALNLSTALQIKINDLRAAIGMTDFTATGGPKAQAQEIVQALLDGQPVALDSKDILELLVPDTSALKEVAQEIHTEISFILGLPPSWLGVKQAKGLGDSGDADARAIERGLEPYFWESAYPSFKGLFDVKLKFKTEDFRNIGPALEAMRTFQLDDGELLPKEIQQRILYQLLDVQEEPPGIIEVEPKEPEVIVAPPKQDAKEDDAE